MPRVRYTDDGGSYRVAGVTFEPGDEADVSADLADHLIEDTNRFERVDEHVTDVEYTEVDADDSDDEDGPEADVTDEELDEAGEDIEEPDDDICGYEKDDGSVCQRTAGWGRDADTGHCQDHHEED